MFTGTKCIRDEHFLCFANEKGSSVEVPIDESIMIWFMRYMDRLAPPTKPVEGV